MQNVRRLHTPDDRVAADNRWFRALVEHAHDWIVVLDQEAVVRYASPSIERVLGYQPDERIGRPTLELVHPDDLGSVRAALGELLRTPGGSGQVEARCRHRDGSWRVLDVIGRNLLEEPSVCGIVVHARDITEQVYLRTRRETLLRVARHLALETAPEQVMRTLLNEAVQLTGGDFGIVARWDDNAELLRPVWSTLPTEGPVRDATLGQGTGGAAAETRRPVIMNDYQAAENVVPEVLAAGVRALVAAPLLHEARLLGVVTVASVRPGKQFGHDDASALEVLAGLASSVLVGMERSRLEGALLAARTAQHALNNQLAAVLGFADLVAGDDRLPEDLRALLNEIVVGAREAAASVEQLGRIAHLEELDEGGPGPVLDLARSSESRRE